MTWTISHGPSRPGHHLDGRLSYGYGTVGEWRDAVDAQMLSNRDRALLAPLLRQRSDADPFEIPTRQAGAIAAILRGVQQRMPRGLRGINESIIAAAERASAAGRPWQWS